MYIQYSPQDSSRQEHVSLSMYARGHAVGGNSFALIRLMKVPRGVIRYGIFIRPRKTRSITFSLTFPFVRDYLFLPANSTNNFSHMPMGGLHINGVEGMLYQGFQNMATLPDVSTGR